MPSDTNGVISIAKEDQHAITCVQAVSHDFVFAIINSAGDEDNTKSCMPLRLTFE
jgi:hypothetical protein